MPAQLPGIRDSLLRTGTKTLNAKYTSVCISDIAIRPPLNIGEGGTSCACMPKPELVQGLSVWFTHMNLVNPGKSSACVAHVKRFLWYRYKKTILRFSLIN